MSTLFKSKGRLIVTMCVVILAITVVAAAMAFFLGGDVSVGPAPVTSEGEEEEVLPVIATADAEQIELEPEELPVTFHTPSEMRGVFLVPGKDFLTGSDTSRSTVTAQIDTALASAQQLTMNTVIIDTVYMDKVIYAAGDSRSVSGDWDVMQYIVDQSRQMGFYTYAIFDTSLCQQASTPVVSLAVGAGTTDTLSANLGEFAAQYRLDGILIDGYQNPQAKDSYGLYLTAGGAMGYENYMRQSPRSVIQTASETVRSMARNTQVGLLADAVWANEEEDEAGSNTNAAFTALGTANADTKGFVEDKLVDFVAVKAYASLTDTAEPFGGVVEWWADIAAQSSVALYVVHASDKICTENAGWESHDQLTRQIIEAEMQNGYRGSAFNSLSRLVENPKEAATTLIKYFNDEVQAAHILTELEITKPAQTTFSTFEPAMTFTGASDPNSPVFINEAEIPTDESGYFTVSYDLEAGLNSFSIEHKEKTLRYSITRQVQVLQEMSPQENISTEGGMTITITANAYNGATVWATINGAKVSLEIDEESVEDEEDRDSNYKMFVGEYTAPAATDSQQNLGNITVYASWEGMQDSMQGGSITVNKRAKVEDGVPVRITTDQARTYPPDTLNNIPDSNYYPLPKGAMDYAVGDEIVYKKKNTAYTYYVLASGLRVQTKDLQAVSEYPSENVISAMSVEADRDFTYVTLKMTQTVAYTFTYASTGVSVEFHYTTTVPKGLELNKNPIFNKAAWSDSTLKLSFIKENGFMGYKGYFDNNGNLVLRFNNPPSSISGAKIAIDPGHGGSDPGSLGFLAEYPEKVVNRAIAEQLKEELQSRGATVMLMNTSNNPSKLARVQHAENWNADIMISVHNNSTTNSSANGTEVYYFTPFSRTLALYSSAKISSKFGSTNRGGKKSYYDITLSSQMASVLVEGGFMSNKNEYEKLLKTSNQRKIAAGIADGIEVAISTARTGSSATGLQSVGGSVSAGSQSGGSGASESGDGIDVNGNSALTLNKTKLTMEIGATYLLEAEKTGDITWKSSDSAVVTVDADGKVKAVAEGTAVITAASDDGEAACTIKVIKKAADSSSGSNSGKPLEDAGDVYLKETDITLSAGKTKTLTVQSDIGDIRPGDFTWESSDTSVATVDEYGIVTAVATGTADITAVSRDEKHGMACAVTVE